MTRRILIAIAICASPLAAAAQTGGPYVAGHIGMTGGDGGASPAAGGSVGYMMPRRLGFEIEVSVSPGLDSAISARPNRPRSSCPGSRPSIFPPARPAGS